jgi:hypothetical protein
MTSISALAISTCAAADGWMPSSEMRGPKVWVGLARFGNGGICPDARAAANRSLGSQYPNPISAALSSM